MIYRMDEHADMFGALVEAASTEVVKKLNSQMWSACLRFGH
jgi:hypothetical protein